MKLLLWVAIIVTTFTGISVFAAESIEVGFSQDDEPEPHMLAVLEEGQVKLYQLEPLSKTVDRKVAKEPTNPPKDMQPKTLSLETFNKRMAQIVETEHFFSASQPRPKARCKDKYVVRVKHNGKFRERRGCSLQSDDRFAGFAQNMFRDTFWAWNKR